MNVSFVIYRSEKWVDAQRLESGENVKECVQVLIDIKQLSEFSRKILLQRGGGEYDEYVDIISYSREGKIGRYGAFSEKLCIDAKREDITTASVEKAIHEMHNRISTHVNKIRERDKQNEEKEKDNKIKKLGGKIESLQKQVNELVNQNDELSGQSEEIMLSLNDLKDKHRTTRYYLAACVTTLGGKVTYEE